MWNLHPRTNGGGGNYGQSEHKGNFFRATYFDGRGAGGPVSTDSWTRTLSDPNGDGFSDFPGRVQWFVDFATNTYPAGAAPWIRKASNAGGGGTDSDINRQKGYGYKYLEWESRYGGWADSANEPTTAANLDFPNKPTLVASGDPAFPVSSLTFTPSAFSDPQGAGTFAAWQWRIAEISAPGIPGHVTGERNKYEIETIARSGDLTTAPAAFTIPLGVAEAGKTYRVRVRQKDTTGNWSHWSAPVQFAATATQASLAHYWNFNNPATLLTPTQTAGGGALAVAGTYLADTGQDFAAENARNGDTAGSHLRVNNPLTAGTQLTFTLPTTHYQNVIVKYETRRSGQGAGTQNVSYTLDGSTYVPFATYTIADADPVVQNLDFRNLAEANDNPLFGIRITFSQGSGGTAGNNRFDNLTVEADALPSGFETWKLASFPNPEDLADESISGPAANPSGDGVANLIRYAHGVGPYDPVATLLPTLTKSASTFDFRFRYDATKTDLIWKVKATNVPDDWPNLLFDSRTSPIPPLDDGWLPVPLPAYLGTGPAQDPRMFVRLEVELVTP
jgi:hypothetical protein